MVLRMKSSVVAFTFTFGLAVSACGYEAYDDASDDEPLGATDEELRSGVHCSVRRVMGYRNGAPFALNVVSVGGKPVSVPTAHAFLRWQAAADRAGVRLAIRSGFRTYAEQQRLYECFRSPQCNGNPADPPGRSDHQNGAALDLDSDNWTWVRSNAARFGFQGPLPNERWHYEFHGADPGGICGQAGGTTTSNGSASPAKGSSGASGSSSSSPAPSAPSKGEAEEPATTGTSKGGAQTTTPTAGQCMSGTLGRNVPQGTCVQAASTETWFQCQAGQWFRGVNGNTGPYGACTSMFALSGN